MSLNAKNTFNDVSGTPAASGLKGLLSRAFDCVSGVRSGTGYKERTTRLTLFGINVGLLHSENDEPSRVYKIGGITVREWHRYGRLHRDGDRPAKTSSGFGTSYEWYQNGKLHRDNGPAVSDDGWSSSSKAYYKHGKLHRDDGPARVYNSSYGEHWKLWAYNGVEYKSAAEYEAAKQSNAPKTKPPTTSKPAPGGS